MKLALEREETIAENKKLSITNIFSFPCVFKSLLSQGRKIMGIFAKVLTVL